MANETPRDWRFRLGVEPDRGGTDLEVAAEAALGFFKAELARAEFAPAATREAAKAIFTDFITALEAGLAEGK